MRILFIEDDDMLGKATTLGLRKDFTVDWFQSGEEGLTATETSDFDLLLLDINLPGMSGLELLKKIRDRQIDMPVLLLTARDRTEQKIKGLDLGADDYMVKPFDLSELKSRIRALERRSHGRATTTIKHKNIELDVTGKSVTKDGKPLDLSARELVIITILMQNIGKTLSREQIEDKLYGFDIEIESNTIEVHISNLRKKLGKDFILTKRGIGYTIE